MTRRPRHPLRVLESRRLTLVAATEELVQADLAGPEQLAEAIAAGFGAVSMYEHDGWRPSLYPDDRPLTEEDLIDGVAITGAGPVYELIAQGAATISL